MMGNIGAVRLLHPDSDAAVSHLGQVSMDPLDSFKVSLPWSDPKARNEIREFINEILGLISWEQLSA